MSLLKIKRIEFNSLIVWAEIRNLKWLMRWYDDYMVMITIMIMIVIMTIFHSWANVSLSLIGFALRRLFVDINFGRMDGGQWDIRNLEKRKLR